MANGTLDALKAVQTRMDTLWSDDAAVLYEEDGVSAPADFAPFVRLTIREGDGNQIDLAGARSRSRVRGIIYVDAFTKRAIGTARARELADLACQIFEGKQFAGIHVEAARSGVQGPDPDQPGYFRHQIKFPYFRFRELAE